MPESHGAKLGNAVSALIRILIVSALFLIFSPAGIFILFVLFFFAFLNMDKLAMKLAEEENRQVGNDLLLLAFSIWYFRFGFVSGCIAILLPYEGHAVTVHGSTRTLRQLT